MSGFLEVGFTENNEIVINHPQLEVDANGVGHIVFSIEQARALVAILWKKAYEAEERNLRNGDKP